VKVYLIGHSSTAKYCLELLKLLPKFCEQVLKFYLLMPSIERVPDSIMGRITSMINSFSFLFRLILKLFNQLPMNWKIPLMKCLMKIYVRTDAGVEEYFMPCLKLANPQVFDRVLFLAHTSFNKMKDLDEDIIKSNIHRLKLYYAVNDEFVNSECYHKIIERIPGIDAELCSRGFQHGFVLDSSPEVGKMVGEWINDFKKRM